MQVIPAIDIIDRKAVRLTKGDYDRKIIYHEDPLEVALQFEAAGFTRLHLVDLDGAKAGKIQNSKILKEIASNTKLAIDFSGGIHSTTDLDLIFDYGVSYAAIGSMAVKAEAEVADWFTRFGVEHFIISCDVKDNLIAVKGWTETSSISIFDLINKYQLKGIKEFFCTDINKDGLLQGPSFNLYKEILQKFPMINLVASGGVSSLDDLEQLKQIGCSAAIVGKAFYEKTISLTGLKQFMK